MRKILVLLAILSIGGPCAARTITVDDDGAADFNTVQAAIDDSNDGDTIVVYPGRYTGAGNRDIDYGGRAITVRSTKPNDSNIVAATIIDCNGTETEPHRGFWFHSGEEGSSVLGGITITNGYSEYGGGIFGENESSPRIIYCTISNNSAVYGGGVYDCDGQISKCLITGNRAGDLGGGLYGCDGPIVGCTVSNNVSERDGGGLSQCEGPIIRCTISGNVAQEDDSGGLGGCGDIINCVISGNSAGEDAGGMGMCYGSIMNCVISGNSAGNRGGALRYCDAVVVNCTIVGNFAGRESGGIYGSGGIISNCIIFDNRSGDSSVMDLSVVPVYSCVQVGSDGRGCIDTDPCFVVPGYWDTNSTPNSPDDDFWVEGNYDLRAESPCIDSGNYHHCMVVPCSDLGGDTRFTGGQIDMGCYEAGGLQDSDGDWLADNLEPGYVDNPDRDRDGILDGLELLRGTNPDVFDPLGQWNVPNDVSTIQEALFFSRAGETIVLREGTYYENINMGGRNIVLRSTKPDDADVIARTVLNGDVDANSVTADGRVITFGGTEDANCRILGLTLTGGYAPTYGGGISGGRIFYSHTGAVAEISNCIISGNSSGGGGGTLCQCDGSIINCTIVGNLAEYRGGAMYRCDGPISNCIIWDNRPGDSALYKSSTPVYSCVQRGSSGLGCIGSDPCFVEPGYWDGDLWVGGDYHLRSEGWRWDREGGDWSWDDVTSRCIDAGNPGSAFRGEPLSVPPDPFNRLGQNLRINMGAYGGTAKASMGPYDWALLSDVSNDGVTDFVDVSYFTDYWLCIESEQPGDFDRNGVVDFEDFAWLGGEWLGETSWR